MVATPRPLARRGVVRLAIERAGYCGTRRSTASRRLVFLGFKARLVPSSSVRGGLLGGAHAADDGTRARFGDAVSTQSLGTNEIGRPAPRGTGGPGGRPAYVRGSTP